MLHEKLMCYRQSVQLAEDTAKEMARWPRGYGFLADQLRRAVASVILNMAEGNARKLPRERRRFFQVSRASLAEVSACIDLMRAYRLVSKVQSDEFKAKLNHIGRLLYGLC